MKVLFELPLKTKDYKETKYRWLENSRNWLFVIESGKVLRTISIDQEPGKELHSATLTESRLCTSLSWNKDGTKLAIIVDFRLIYLWDIENNSFNQFKPAHKLASSSNDNNSNLKRMRQGNSDIDLVSWSKLTNKFVLCYSSAQILICDCDSNLSEKFVDNSDGVLKRISQIKASQHIDIFACISIIFEVLIMTFGGETKLYIQAEDLDLRSLKFSIPAQNSNTSSMAYSDYCSIQESIWLSYLTRGKIYLKKIFLHNNRFSSQISVQEDMVYVGEAGTRLVEFHWLSSNSMIACHSSGLITLLQVNSLHHDNSGETEIKLVEQELLKINQNDDLQAKESVELRIEEFEAFVLSQNSSSKDEKYFSLVAMTDHKLFYYQIFGADFSQPRYTCEKVDDLNLTESLKRINLKLESVIWCFDCSMIAVQLTNAHILIYRTKLSNHMVTTNCSRTAYLSASNEITILNYGFDDKKKTLEIDSQSPSNEDFNLNDNRASIMNLDYNPSLIAIGPKHLAVALNNRIRLYLIDYEGSVEQRRDLLVDEHEYVSIAVSISLSSRYIAVHFDDGRLKLHSIRQQDGLGTTDREPFSTDERFFPDPSKPETISAFVVTEKAFIYCTREYCLKVFNLASWSLEQSCNYSSLVERAVLRLKANERENKFICLLEESVKFDDQNNVCLYILNSNKMISIESVQDDNLWKKMIQSQMIAHHVYLKEEYKFKCLPSYLRKAVKLNRILEAIWDVDGKNVLLIERKLIHIAIVLNHTLGSDSTLVLHVASVSKASSYTPLYASHGIVSFQTSLGRIINSILAPFDDESNLTNLEEQINDIKSREIGNAQEKQLEVFKLKLDYLHSILPIYSLSKCKDICEHLMNEDQFKLNNATKSDHLDRIIWSQLAAWSLFKMNLNFALLIYRKYGPSSNARAISEIIDDARNRDSDSKLSIKTRLLIMLNCEM